MATPNDTAAAAAQGEIMDAAQAFKDKIAADHGGGAKNSSAAVSAALGQKEEGGMTRFQMKKEAKRLMYLQSTEAAPELLKVNKKNVTQRYYPGGMSFPGGPKSKKAFWGLSKGSQQPYVKRPSRTEMLKNPKLAPKILTKGEVLEREAAAAVVEAEALAKKKAKKNKRKKYSSSSSSSSSSGSSSSGSDSDSDSGSGSSSSSSSSSSGDEPKKKKKRRKTGD